MATPERVPTTTRPAFAENCNASWAGRGQRGLCDRPPRHEVPGSEGAILRNADRAEPRGRDAFDGCRQLDDAGLLAAARHDEQRVSVREHGVRPRHGEERLPGSGFGQWERSGLVGVEVTDVRGALFGANDAGVSVERHDFAEPGLHAKGGEQLARGEVEQKHRAPDRHCGAVTWRQDDDAGHLAAAIAREQGAVEPCIRTESPDARS